MRVSREQAAENRARVLAGASRLFRERGIDGVAVSELMAESGLTHGGFYGQFESKDALAAEACALALENSAARWRGLAEAGGAAAIHARYLSPAQVNNPAGGCALPALAVDVARSRDRRLRETFTDGLSTLIDTLASALPGSAKARRTRALQDICTMVGATVLARAARDAALSKEIIAAAEDAVA